MGSHSARPKKDIIEVTLWNKRRHEDILAETGEAPVKDQLKLR